MFNLLMFSFSAAPPAVVTTVALTDSSKYIYTQLQGFVHNVALIIDVTVRLLFLL